MSFRSTTRGIFYKYFSNNVQGGVHSQFLRVVCKERRAGEAIALIQVSSRGGLELSSSVGWGEKLGSLNFLCSLTCTHPEQPNKGQKAPLLYQMCYNQLEIPYFIQVCVMSALCYKSTSMVSTL